MSMTKAGLLGLGAGLVAGAILSSLLISNVGLEDDRPDAFGRNEIASNGNIQGETYLGMPGLETKLVQVEDERLVYVRTVASAAQWSKMATDGPYRLKTGSTFTLVLTARAEPYTIDDLIEIAPDTFVSQGADTYLLSESIMVLAGAALSLTSETDLTILLASDSERFTSIISMGGALTVAGTETSTVSVRSWDSSTQSADSSTEDGRAYVRAVGGAVTLSHAQFSDLGFWSGNTGGLALTGTDEVGSFDVAGSSDAASADGATTDEAATGVTTTDPTNQSTPEVGGALLLPAGAFEDTAASPESQPFVTGTLDNVTSVGNAFGLFVTNAVGVVVTNSEIRNSLVDGLVFHRFVTDSSVTDTKSSNNAVDGFSLARSTAGVELTRLVATDNGRNGISIDGQPLADGPSAVGTEVESYGANSVSSSTIAHNGRYGVEVSGGTGAVISASRIASNVVGVVLNHGSTGVVISDNTFGAQKTQSIAIREGVERTQVSGNTFAGGDTAIYVRNAGADIYNNTMSSMANHGVSVLGDARGVSVADNTIAGFGTLPIYDKEAVGLSLGVNNLDEWRPAPTPSSVIRSVFQPLTIVWLVLALLLVVTALGPRSLRFGLIRHPYPEQVPLQAFSKGVVARHSLNRAPK